MMFLHERDEILRRVPRERGLAEVRIAREKVVVLCIGVREIASPTAGNANLFPHPFLMFKHENPLPSFAGFDCAHQSRSARTDDDCVRGG